MSKEQVTDQIGNAFASLGFMVDDSDEVTVKCATNFGDFYSAPTFMDLLWSVSNYQLCDCDDHN